MLPAGLHGRRAWQRDIAAVRHGQSTGPTKAQGLEDDRVKPAAPPSSPQSSPQQRDIRTPIEHIDIEFPIEGQADGRQGDAHRVRTAQGAQLQKRWCRVSVFAPLAGILDIDAFKGVRYY